MREEVEGKRLALKAKLLGARLLETSGGGCGGEKEEQKLFKDRWLGIAKAEVAMVMQTIESMMEEVQATIKGLEEEVQAASNDECSLCRPGCLHLVMMMNSILLILWLPSGCRPPCPWPPGVRGHL